MAHYILNPKANISPSVLAKITADFNLIKKNGMKVGLRLTYTEKEDNLDDATPAMVKTHIQQIAAIFQVYILL